MVPFSVRDRPLDYGSPKLERYNGVSSIEIQGQAAQGKSTGRRWRDGKLAKKLPDRYRLFVDRPVVPGNPVRFAGADPVAISILVVFLCLAALYESWSIRSR